jgi:hypothetical protein
MSSSTLRPKSQERPHEQDVARRLLDSAAVLAYDPATEVDWETPLDKDFHGASPEWSSSGWPSRIRGRTSAASPRRPAAPSRSAGSR